MGDTFYVAANVFPTDPLGSLDQRPLTILRVPGGSIVGPPGDFLFAYPKGAVDSRGTYHLIWAEPKTLITDPRRWPGGPLVTLWYSALDDAGWSSPRKLFESARLLLGAEDGVMTLDQKDRLHIVLPVIGANGHGKLAYLRKTGSEWEVREIGTGAAYASILTWSADSITMAYTAADPTVASDGNSVFVATSASGGVAWSEPRLISRTLARDATSPILVRGNGMIHLIWGRRSGSFSITALAGRESADGTVWTEKLEAALPGGALRFHVAAEGAAVTAIVEEFNGQRLSLREVAWEGGSASSKPLFPNYYHAGNAGLGGSLRTTFLVWSGAAAEGQEALTFTSVRTHGVLGDCRKLSN